MTAGEALKGDVPHTIGLRDRTFTERKSQITHRRFLRTGKEALSRLGSFMIVYKSEDEQRVASACNGWF